MMRHHQVVIIGGGLAGAACAIELNRVGVDVVSFDRDRFPRPKVCGAFLSPGAVRTLEALDVLAPIRASGAVAVDRARIRWSSRVIEIPFGAPGLGFSREALDWILADAAGVEAGSSVDAVTAEGNGFRLRVVGSHGQAFEVACDVVVDAAGRHSRFTRRRLRRQYGVQFHTPGPGGHTLEFDFFNGGYGGSVAVEGDRTNSCYLVDRSRVRDYLGRDGCIVTGPVGFDRVRGPYLAIGDAAGMVDPFSGEGMRQALESGRLAANVVEKGLRERKSYTAMRIAYGKAWRQQWSKKKRLAAALRWCLEHSATRRAALGVGSRFEGVPARLLGRLWN